MGVTLTWSSSYPASVDDTTTNFPPVTNNVHDVLASHVNELASAVISLQTVVGGFRSAGVEDPFTSLTDGDVLTYNASAGEWRATAPVVPSVTLQDAYDGGNTITLTAATPVALTTSGVGQDGITVTDGVDTATIRGDQFLGPVGSASKPTFASTADDDTGMYIVSADRLGFATGGTNRLTLRSTQFWPNGSITLGRSTDPWLEGYITTVLAGDGAVGAPSYAFATDPTKGFYHIGAGSIGYTYSGTERIRFTNQFIRHKDTGAVGTPTYSWIDHPTTGLWVDAQGSMYVSANGVQVARLQDIANQDDEGALRLQTTANGAGGEGYAGLSVQVTETATGTATTSLGGINRLIDARVGGTTVFAVAGNGGSTYGTSGGVLAADGTAAAPSYTFLTDPTTGLYYTTNTIRFSIAGTQELYLRATELAPLSDGGLSLGTTVAGFDNIYCDSVGGTVGAPGFSFAGDTNTGVYRNNTDSVAIAGGGSQVVRFDNSTGNPQVIAQDGSGADPSYSFNGDTGMGFYNHATGTVAFTYGGARRILFHFNYLRHLSKGSAGVPTYSWVNDTDTGIWSSGNDIINFSAAGDEVVRMQDDAAWDDGNLQVTKDLVEATAVEQVWQNDGGVFTDITTAAANATSNDTNLYPASSATGDYVAIGMDEEFVAVVFDAAGGTGGTNQPTITWEYWDGSAWSALTLLREETLGFSATNDDMVVQWNRPSDWATTTLNSVTKYYVRARISFSQFTTSPIYDQIKVVSDQIGLAINIVDAATITTGAYSRVDGIRMSGFGVPGGLVQIRPFVFEYEGAVQVAIQTKSSGGSSMFLPEGGGPAYAFLDGNGHATETLGMGGSTSSQYVNFFTDVTGSATEQFRILTDQVQAQDGDTSAPGYSFLSDPADGMSRISASRLGLMVGGERVELDSSNTSWAPATDNNLSLGFSGRRWSDVFAAATTIGDLIMHDTDEGEDSPFLILRESHETIEVYDVQANKKFIIPLQEVEMTAEDQARIDAARAKLYGEN